MKKSLEFKEISKRYPLGLTRTSMPALLAAWTKRILNPGLALVLPNQHIWALRSVSFDLEPGESLALVGANGAGKTTILKILAQVTRPSSGSLHVNGRLSALIELGAGFHPELTGRENVFLNGTILGLKRAEIRRRFDEIVAFSELEKFIDTPVKRYSSGMAVRLGFAVAACIEPEILLVDEVLAVGDASFRQKCLKRIRKLLDAGTSLIFVSHNLYMVEATCSRALYLKNGHLKAEGGTQEIIQTYERDLHEAEALGSREPEIVGAVRPGNLEIETVEVLGEGAPAEGVLASDQPALIRIGYKADRDIEAANMSVFIRRSDGLICCMMRTKLDGVSLQLQRGSGLISLRLEQVQLIGGVYIVEVYFLDQSDSLLLTQRGGRSRWFSVSGKGISSAEDSGVYEPMVTWHQQPGAS